MKHVQLFLALLIMAGFSKAQLQVPVPAKIKEFGLGFSSLKNYALQYRWGNERKIKRVSGFISAAGSMAKSENKTSFEDTAYVYATNYDKTKSRPRNFDVGLALALLQLRKFNERFGYFFGPAVSGNYGYSDTYTERPVDLTTSFSGRGTQSKEIRNQYGLSLGFTFGLSMKISADFYLYAELSPQAYYNFTTTYLHVTTITNSSYSDRTYRGSSINYGVRNITNSKPLLSLIYRLTKV